MNLESLSTQPISSEQTHQPKKLNMKKHLFIALLALIAVNILLYANTFKFNFLTDDYRLIVENPRITNLNAYLKSIPSPFFVFPDYPHLHYWRPMSLFSFFIDYQLWELNPAGYHLTNVLLNTCNALLIFFIFYALLNHLTSSFFISLIFTVHPSHVEAVSWISGRTDLLGAFFILSSILSLIYYLKKKSTLNYFVMLLCFVLALLSKENSVIFPLIASGIILLWTITHNNLPALQSHPSHRVKFILKRIFTFTLPLWLITIGYVLLHSHVTGSHQDLSNFSLKDIPIICKTIGTYVQVILLPFLQSPHFSMHQFDQSTFSPYYYFFFGLSIFAILLFSDKNRFKFSLYGLLFFLFLLPVLDLEIVPSYPKIVYRFAYLPVVFSGVFFVEMYRNITKKSLRRFAAGLFIVISLIWTAETYVFQDYYKDKYSHFEGLLRYDPWDASLMLPLALIYAQDGLYQNAFTLADRVLDPRAQSRWMDVTDMASLLKANLLVVTGKIEEGKTIAQSILNQTHKPEMSFFGNLILSKYYEKKADPANALFHLSEARKYGQTAELFYQYTVIYAKMKDFKKALIYLRKAKELNPGEPRYQKIEKFLEKYNTFK